VIYSRLQPQKIIARKSKGWQSVGREQIDADKIIKEYLNELGEKVYQQATETSRRDTGVCKMNRITRYNPILF
jgi:hypothetical protein